MKQILKRCLENVIKACEKYNVDFGQLLTEISIAGVAQSGKSALVSAGEVAGSNPSVRSTKN